MKRSVVITLCIVLAISFFAFAQESRISVDNIKKTVSFLADPELKGRFPGTEGYLKAADYIEENLKQAGLTTLPGTKTYRNMVPLKNLSWKAGSKLRIVGGNDAEQYLLGSRDLLLTRAGNDVEVKGKPIYLGYGISEPELGWDDLAGHDLKGKIVIIKYGFPNAKEANGKFPADLKKKYRPGMGEPAKVARLNEAGVALVLQLPTPMMSARWNFIYHIENTRLNRKPSYEISRGATVISVHPDFQKRLFRDEGYSPADKAQPYKTFELKQLEIQGDLSFTVKEYQSPNIVAAVAGTDPELKNEWIVFGAHLDHVGVTLGKVYPGAVDNATGCAVILETARAFVKNPQKRSIAFVFYTAEECGLLGSTWFVNNGPLKDKKIVLNINIDEAGKLNPRLKDISVIGIDRKDPSLRELLMAVKEKLQDVELSFSLDKTMPEERYAVSDHYPYHVKGIPAVVFYNGPYRENHMPEDTIELVDFNLTHKFARLAYNFGLAVAQR